MTNSSPAKSPHFGPESDRTTWPVRLSSLLLLLQVAGLSGGGVYEGFHVDWTTAQQQLATLSTVDASRPLFDFVILALFFGPLALLTLVAAVGILFLWRFGWTLAMVSQGLMLLLCLSLYFGAIDFPFVFPIMASCVVIVFIMNANYVRQTFRPPQSLSEAMAPPVEPTGEGES